MILVIFGRHFLQKPCRYREKLWGLLVTLYSVKVKMNGGHARPLNDYASFAYQMPKYVLILVFVLLFQVNAHGQQTTGISAFAIFGKNFPCKALVSTFGDSQTIAVATLVGTFGNDFTCINSLVESNRGKSFIIEFHLSNGSCRAFNRCGAGELFGSLTSKQFDRKLRNINRSTTSRIQTRLAPIKSFIDQYKSENIKILISAELETRCSKLAIENFFKVIKDEIPAAFLVFNPVGETNNFVPIGTDFVELHGLRPKFRGNTSRICSNDGNVINLQSARSYFRQAHSCQMLLPWSKELQGIIGHNRRFVRPRDRRFVFTSTLKKLFMLARSINSVQS